MPVKKLPGILGANGKPEVAPPKPPSLSLDNSCKGCGKLGHASYNDPDWVASYLSNGDSTVFCYSCGHSTPLSLTPPMDPPSTQKVKGMFALQKYVSVAYVRAILPRYVTKVKEELNKGVTTMLPLFARPCPPNPEHGFVESRLVSTYEEAEQVRKETLAANEDSELMFMELIKAELNALWTPSMLAVGPGHDGATAGKNCVSVPLMGLSDLSEEIIAASGMKPDAGPYVEAVLTHEMFSGNDTKRYKSHLTQLRGGPVLPVGVGPDFVPESMVVQSVVQTNNEDLLEWAKVVKGLKDKPGVVVYHPGGALTDHYSVHCRENGVPIVLSFEPAVGLVLEPSEALMELDPNEVLRGILAGNKVDFKHDYASYVRLLLMSLHNSAVLRGPHSFWIGLGVSSILKLGVAALEGEARHAHSCYQGMKAKPDIYGYYTARTLSFARARLSRVSQILHYGFGDPDQPKSFGGKKWALCGAALVPLFNQIKKLAEEPTPANASELVLALNVAVNQAHNGGWWLNKFIDNGAYDRIPKGSMGDAVAASGAFWAGDQARKSISETDLKKFVSQVAKWPLTEIKPLKWRKVSFDVAPGAFVLNLKAATLPTAKTLTIAATPTMIKAMLAAAGELRIERGTIDLIKPGGEIVSIWKEDPLVAESRDVKRR